MNRAAKAGSVDSTRSISFFAIRRTAPSVSTAAVASRRDWPFETALAEETAGFQQCDDGLFTTLGDDGQLDPAVVNKEHGIRRVPLCENHFALVALDKGFSRADSRQELCGIEVFSAHRNPALRLGE